MITLHAEKWFKIVGRGSVVSIDARQIPGVPHPIRHVDQIPLRTGQHVLIDGAEFKIINIEYAQTMMYPPQVLPFIAVCVIAIDISTGLR